MTAEHEPSALARRLWRSVWDMASVSDVVTAVVLQRSVSEEKRRRQRDRERRARLKRRDREKRARLKRRDRERRARLKLRRATWIKKWIGRSIAQSEQQHEEQLRSTRFLLTIAVQLLPPSERDRHLEEFRAELLDVPRETRLRHAQSLVRGVFVLRLRRGFKNKAAETAVRRAKD